MTSPLGILELRASTKGLLSISLTEKMLENEVEMLANCHVLLETTKQLREYFEGSRKEFDLPLDFPNATAFQKNVWNELLKIPYGKTISYSDLALRVGSIMKVRAVGTANGSNPIPIIVPCHRVIGKSGDLVGYALGLPFKRALLALENPNAFLPQGELF